MVTKRSIHCAIGWLTVEIKFDCIVRIDFQDEPILIFGEHPLFAALENQLHAYFNGELKQFNLPIRAHGTPFQLSIWEELQKIPYGTTVSYQTIAKSIKNEKAVRAVGQAIGKNPIAIVIPCHRVIGKNNQLTGFAGGLERKMKLLQCENFELFPLNSK
jgi:methylated-DNA-[protein]-cysteine S-methyltransferase